MAAFIPEKIQTNVDFIAYSVAVLELKRRDITAQSVSGNMPPEMARQFYDRLRYYRSFVHTYRLNLGYTEDNFELSEVKGYDTVEQE